MTVSGTLSLAGTPQDVGACAISGSGVAAALALTLKSGAIVTLPIHESSVVVQASADGSKETLSCEKHSMSGSGSDTNYAGDITLLCGEGKSALEMALSIQCGVAGPSNRSPDDEGPPN